MSESLQPGYDRGDNDWELQYGTLINVKHRWEVYRYSELPDIHEAIINKLVDRNQLKPGDSVLDVGCSDGHLLRNLRLQRQHQGALCGIDPWPDQFWTTQYYLSELAKEGHEIEPIVFMRGEAQDLYPLPDNSQDVLLALFVLYHLPKDEQPLALAEFKRVLKPGGRLVVATSGKDNKLKHRYFERRIAAELGVEPPPLMNQNFDSDEAKKILPRYFSDVEHTAHHGHLKFNKQNYMVYIQSLLTMASEFRPAQSSNSLNPAIEKIVKPQIEAEIEEKGNFIDTQERDYFICTNDKD